MNDVHSYMQGQAGLMDASSAHDLDFLNFDDRGPFLSKYEANDSHGLFSNSMNGFTVSQYSGDNIQLTTSELLNESSSHHYTNSSEINSHDNSPTNLPDLALYNHNNEKMTSINPKIAHPDLQPFMPEDHSVTLGMNNFQTIFEEAAAKDTESNFGNLEMRKDARAYSSNYSQYNTTEVDDEKTDDEGEEAFGGNKYRRGKKDIAWRWTWLNLQIAELHKQIQVCDNLLHNIQVEKEIIPADLGTECARTAGLRINKRVKIVKLTAAVQASNKQFHPLFVPSLANVPSLTAPQPQSTPARPRGKQDYPMSPPRTAPRGRKDLAMSTPNGPRANNSANKGLKSSEPSARKKLTKSDPRNNIRRSTPSRPRDREYDVDNVILPGRVSSLRRSVDKTPKEIFTPTFRIRPELSPEEEWKQYEADHSAKKARKKLREDAQQGREEAKQAVKVLLPSPSIALTESFHLDSASMEEDDDILLIKTSLESSPTSDKSRSHAVDTSLDADLLRIESMASIDRAEALKSFQATFEQSRALWKHESADADSQSVNSTNSPVLISAPVPQLPVSCEDNSQCNRQSSELATMPHAEEDSESSSYSSDEEDISDMTYALRHFRSELRERIRWEKPDPTSPHYNTYMKEEEFLVSRLYQSYTAHHELGQRLPPELWQDNIIPDEEEPSYSYLHERSDDESSQNSHTGTADGLRPRRKRPLSPSSESSHPPKRARVERRDDDFIRDYDRHITGLNM